MQLRSHTRAATQAAKASSAPVEQVETRVPPAKRRKVAKKAEKPASATAKEAKAKNSTEASHSPSATKNKKATQKSNPAPAQAATLSTLPNEIQQQIYEYAIERISRIYRFKGLGTSHDMMEQDITYNLLRVSRSVQANLLTVVRMHGSPKLKAHVKAQLYMWALDTKQAVGMKWKQADAEAKALVEASDIRVYGKPTKEEENIE